MSNLAVNQKLFEGISEGSALDFQTAFHEKLSTVMERKVGHLFEQDADRSVALEVEIAAKSFGGETSGNVNGVVAVDFRNHQAATHYADWLEEQKEVEYYEISASFKDAVTSQKVDATDIDFDDIMDDSPYTFTVIAYLYPEYTDFTHDYDQDGDEDAGDEAFEIEAESELQIHKYNVEELQEAYDTLAESDISEISKELLGRYIKKAAQHRVKLAGIDHNISDKEANIQRAKHGADKDTQDALDTAQDKLRKQRNKVDDKSVNRAVGISKAVNRLTKEGIEAFERLTGEQIDEVMRKIRVNAHGLKTIKMKCAKGFKWNPSLEACMKITGSELSTMRKASRRAIITKKNEGQALKTRVKRRLRKAFKFRQMMGLKI